MARTGHDLHVYSQKTLGSGDIRTAVALPRGEDMNEWLAVNTVDFFNEVCSSCFVEVLRGSGPRCADQLVVRHHCRVLYRRVVPGDESLGVRAVVPYPCSASMPSLSLALAASTDF